MFVESSGGSIKFSKILFTKDIICGLEALKLAIVA